MRGQPEDAIYLEDAKWRENEKRRKMNHYKQTFQLQVCLRIIFIDYIDNDQIIKSPNPEWKNILGKKLKAYVLVTRLAYLQISP